MKSFKLKIQAFENIRKFFCLSIIFSLSIVCYFTSVLLIEVASAVLLLKTLAFWIILFSILILKEKLDVSSVASLILGFTGMVLIFYGSFKFNFTGFVSGGLSGIFASLVFVLIIRWFKGFCVKSLMLYHLSLSSLILAPFAMMNFPGFGVLYENLFVLFALALISTVIPYFLILDGSFKVKGQFIGVLQNSELLLPIILAHLIFTEPFRLTVLFGGLLISLSYLPIIILGGILK